MPNSIEPSCEKRVLFTGNGIHVINDLMVHIPQQYLSQRCPLVEMNLLDALHKFNPHVIVVCLAQETRVSLRMLAVLDQSTEYSTLPVIAIGNQDDCDLFEQQVLLANTQVFVRPLDQPRFIGALDSCVEYRISELERMDEARLRGSNNAAPAAVPVGTAASAASAASATAPVAIAPAIKLSPLARERAVQTILVVDDDVNMLNAVKLCLQDLYDVVVVPSGKLALKYLSRKSADLVLLDYMMPEMDGPEVLRLIRTESPHPDIPVVFLTGVAEKDLVMRGLEFRPNSYLLKPVNRGLLLETVVEILLGL